MSQCAGRRKSIETDKENMKNALRNWRKAAQKQHESPFKLNESIERKNSTTDSCNSSTGSRTQDYRRKLQAKAYLLGVKTNLINKDLLTRSKELFNYPPSSSSNSSDTSSSFVMSNTTKSTIKSTPKTNQNKKVSFTDKVRYIHPPYKIQNEIEKNKKKNNSISISINKIDKENSIPTSPSRSTLEKSTITNSFSNNSQYITSPSHISSGTDESTKIPTKTVTNANKNTTTTRIEDENMKLTIKSPKVNIKIRPLQDILDDQKNINNKIEKSQTTPEEEESATSSSTSSFYTSLHHTPSSIIYNNTSNPLNNSSQFISEDNISNQNPSFFKNTSLYSFQALHSLKLRQAILHYNQTLCRKVLLHWEKYTDNRIIKNEINNKINKVINLHKKKRYLGKWKEWSDTLIRTRNIYNQIKNKNRKNKLKQIFKIWKEYKNKGITKKRNNENAERFKRIKTLSYYYKLWKKYHNKQLIKVKNMNKVNKYIYKKNVVIIKDIFVKWKMYYLKRNRINEIYIKLYNKKRNKVFKKYYQHWSDVYSENKFVTNKYVEIKLKNFFNQWKDYVFDRRLDRYYYEKRMKSSLRYWKQKTDKMLKLNKYYEKFKKKNDKKIKNQIFNYWNRISKIQTYENKRLKRIMREKKKKQLKKYFKEWKRISKIEAKKQRQIVEYQLYIQKFRLNNIFSKWKNYVIHKKIREKNEFKIIKFYTKNLKKKIFLSWKERYKKNKRRRIIIYILKFIQKRYYFHQWYVNMRINKKERKSTKIALQFYYRNILNKYFDYWKFNSIINKHLLLCNKKAMKYNKYRLLSKYFMKFKMNVNDKLIEKENKKIAIIFNNHSILRKYFNRYIKIVNYMKYQKINYYKAIKFHNDNLLPHFYHKWIDYIFYRYKKVEKYKKCDKYYRKMLLFKGIIKLYKNKENRIYIKTDLNGVKCRNLHLYKMNKYLKIFYEYKELKKYQRQVNSQAIIFYNLKLLKTIFCRWNLYINKIVKNRNEVMKMNYLRRWKYNIENKKQENKMIEICDEYYDRKLMKKMIENWKKYKVYITKINMERKEIEKENYIKNIFNKWYKYVKYKHNKNEMIKKADEFNKYNSLQFAVFQLKDNMNKKKMNKEKIEISKKHHINRKIRMCIDQWYEYKNKRIKNREEINNLMKESEYYYNEKKMKYYLMELYKYSVDNRKMRHFRMLILFKRWKNKTNHIKKEKIKVNKVNVYYNNNLKYKYLFKWRSYIKNRNNKMKRYSKIDNFYHNKQKKKVIKKLYSDKEMNKKVELHNKMRLMKIGFINWIKYHNRKIYMKNKEIECLNYYNNNHKLQLSKYFGLWYKYTEKRMKMKYLNERIVLLNRRKKILSNMFDHWLSLSNANVRLKYNVFIKWCKELEESKRQKRNELKAIRFYNKNQILKFIERLSNRMIEKKENIIKTKEAEEFRIMYLKKKYLHYWKYKIINMWLEKHNIDDFDEIPLEEVDNDFGINKSITKIKIIP